MMIARWHYVCGTALGAMTLAASPAIAQDVQVGPAAAAGATANEAAPGEEIIVTGSRIRRDPLQQDAPVVVVDQAAIAQTGLTSVADVLQRLPSSGGGLNTKFNNSGNLGNPPDGGGVGAGSSEVDLRYLGTKRTLVLVDGLRWVNGSSASGIPASVDLNTIPSNMIDRVEVLQSGASPIYGSDAIAGVVNIITKASQEGLQASAQYGKYRAGDGAHQEYQLSYGFKRPTTSIVVGGTYVKEEAVRSANRSISQFPNPGQTSCTDPIGGCSSAALNGRYLVLGDNYALKTAPIAGRPTFDPTGATGDYRDFTSADRFNFAPFNYIQTPSERYGGFVSAKQEFGADINLRLKGVYNRRNSQNQAAFLPLFIGPDAGNGNLLDTITIDGSNPYNPFGTLYSGTDGTPSNYSFVARRLVEAGQRTYTQHVDTYSATATLDGKLHFGDHTFYWDASAVLGWNNARQSFTGNVNAAKLQQALGPVANCTGACVPFDLFGGAGSVTQAMLDYVGFVEHDRSNQRLQDYTANISGDLFNLPAGPVGIAVGYEHRYQSGSFTPDPVIQAGLGADIPAQAARGHYNVDEVYAELRVPLLKDVAFFKSLEADGAVRRSDYSSSGGKTTFTGSGLWRPVEDILLRGSYAQSFRAPSIGELFGSKSRFDAAINDPCTNVAGSLYQTSAAVVANCAANGVPANGSYQEPQGGQLPVITGGNSALRPETSRYLLFGAVYSPRWARQTGFASSINIEANYYDIKLKNAIAAIDAQVTLERCALNGDPLSCGSVVRTPNGFISQINGVLQNIGSIREQGVDLTFTYRSPHTPIGSFGLTVNNSFLTKYLEFVPAAQGFTRIDRKGTERGSPDQAFPKYKSTSVLDWSISDFVASFTGRYISGVDEADGSRLHHRFYGDLQLTYTPPILDRKLSITAGVINLFNQGPPPCSSCSLNNYDPTTYDIPGQFGYLRIAYKM